MKKQQPPPEMLSVVPAQGEPSVGTSLRLMVAGVPVSHFPAQGGSLSPTLPLWRVPCLRSEVVSF